ncbi:MAG TPA: hypothetical protein VFV17_06905 [Usitatibacteraceae bacterium]|nr:hypothetical protein [Usitatibacteraceae bacterium]
MKRIVANWMRSTAAAGALATTLVFLVSASLLSLYASFDRMI